MVKNVLITGATGFLGKQVVREFIKQGNYKITATDIPLSSFCQFYHDSIRCIRSDITKKNTLIDIVKDHDLLVHVAGLVDLNCRKKLLHAVNHKGVKNIYEAARDSNIKKAIHISSIGVYGKNEGMLLPEHAEKKPKNNYEKSKWKGEQEAFKFSEDIEVVAVRPSTVYGKGSLHSAALPMLNMMEKKVLPYFRQGPSLSHIHVEDAARAIVFLAENDKAKGAYNLADSRPLNSYEMFSSLAEPLGIEVEPKLPYSRTLMRFVKFCSQAVPRFIYKGMSLKLQKKWSQFVEDNNLKPGLKPEIDPIWLDYLVANKAYSNRKLARLGFEFKWPDPKEGLRNMVQDYVDQGYLLKKE